jgi:hypothetical protein
MAISHLTQGAAMTRYIHKDGSPVQDGICVMPDNSVHTLSITLRVSGCSVDESVLKRLLQQRYEVVSIEKQDTTIVVR